MVENFRPPDTDRMVGRVVDRFVLLRSLAEGGMGRVYLAQHVGSSDSRCVIKLMLEAIARNQQMIDRFSAEAKSTARLKHDNIVKLESFGVLDDGIMFLQFEYLEGETLDKHLSNHGGKLPLHRMFHLYLQLLDAMDYAHTMGIVHRDLKPENMFVVLHPRIGKLLKVLDFGICKDLRSEKPKTLSGVGIGTPYYMALEQYVHAAGADHRADIYSMGIIGFEMLTGRLPWGKPDPALLYHKQLTEKPELPPPNEMAPRIAKVLHACLSPREDDRPTAQEVALTIASEIPPIGRAPSGAEMVANLVPRWVVSSSQFNTTMRNAAEIDRIPPMIWTQHETDPGANRAPVPPKIVPHSTPSEQATPVPIARALTRAVAGEIVTPPVTRSFSPESMARIEREHHRPWRPIGMPGEPPSNRNRRRFPGWTLAGLGLATSVIAAVICVAIVRLNTSATDPDKPASVSAVPPSSASPPSSLSQPSTILPTKTGAASPVASPPTAVHVDAVAPGAARAAPSIASHPAPRAAVVPRDPGVDVRDARQDVPKSPPATASQAITLQVASPRDDRVEAQRLSTAPTSPLATQPAAPSKPATPPNPKSNATPINEARRPPDTATGELVVSVDPYAVVYLDGKKVGETPLSTQAPVGQHRLRLVNSDLQVEKTLRVTISEGKPTRVVESW